MMHNRKYKHPATLCFAILRLLKNNGAILREDVQAFIGDHYRVNTNTQCNILRIILSSGFVIQRTFNNKKYLEYIG
jgi:hypothetical protein